MKIITKFIFLLFLFLKKTNLMLASSNLFEPHPTNRSIKKSKNMPDKVSSLNVYAEQLEQQNKLLITRVYEIESCDVLDFDSKYSNNIPLQKTNDRKRIKQRQEQEEKSNSEKKDHLHQAITHESKALENSHNDLINERKNQNKVDKKINDLKIKNTLCLNFYKKLEQATDLVIKEAQENNISTQDFIKNWNQAKNNVYGQFYIRHKLIQNHNNNCINK